MSDTVTEGTTFTGAMLSPIILGKHSGRHSFRQAVEELGFTPNASVLDSAFRRFRELANEKKAVTANDLEALMVDELDKEIARITTDNGDQMPKVSVAVPLSVTVLHDFGRNKLKGAVGEDLYPCRVMVGDHIIGTAYINLREEGLLAEAGRKYMFANRPA